MRCYSHAVFPSYCILVNITNADCRAKEGHNHKIVRSVIFRLHLWMVIYCNSFFFFFLKFFQCLFFQPCSSAKLRVWFLLVDLNAILFIENIRTSSRLTRSFHPVLPLFCERYHQQVKFCIESVFDHVILAQLSNIILDTDERDIAEFIFKGSRL